MGHERGYLFAVGDDALVPPSFSISHPKPFANRKERPRSFARPLETYSLLRLDVSQEIVTKDPLWLGLGGTPRGFSHVNLHG
jgi:hypothetical protein